MGIQAVILNRVKIPMRGELGLDLPDLYPWWGLQQLSMQELNRAGRSAGLAVIPVRVDEQAGGFIGVKNAPACKIVVVTVRVLTKKSFVTFFVQVIHAG